MSNDDDYEIGYGRPPKQTRFRPGKSGNPKGRTKGVRNLATEIDEELRERIVVREGDRQKAITKRRAIVKGQTAKAAKGDTKAASWIFDRLERPSIGAENTAPDLTPDDRAILEAFVAKRTAAPAAVPATALIAHSINDADEDASSA